MAPYCTANDLMLGNIPTPEYLDLDKVVQDAADEMDMVLGQLYVTPINIDQGALPLETRVSRPAALMLKRINASLATGRLLLAVASPEEQTRLHAYAWNCVKEAKDALALIVSGEVRIDNAPRLETSLAPVTAPLIANVDSESNVEAFYDRIANPEFSFGTYFGRRANDRIVR